MTVPSDMDRANETREWTENSIRQAHELHLVGFTPERIAGIVMISLARVRFLLGIAA